MAVYCRQVKLPNCILHLANPAGTRYQLNICGNIQKDKRDLAQISGILAGRGLGPADYSKMYRIRIDVLPSSPGVPPRIPEVNDRVFITWMRTNKALTGWYELWDDPEQTTGEMPSQYLYVKRLIL